LPAPRRGHFCVAVIADGCADPSIFAHEIEVDYVSAINVRPLAEEPASIHAVHEHELR